MKKTHIKCLAMFALGLSFCVACILVVSPSSRAQTTYGSISGIVTDPSGAAIAGAQATLTNLGTSEKHSQSTGSYGFYDLVNLIPGRYRFEVAPAVLTPI